MNDKKIIQMEKALNLKRNFIEKFNDRQRLSELTEIIQDVHYKMAINKIIKGTQLDPFNHYNELRRIAIKIKRQEAEKVFMEICKNNTIEEWIKDNGKYYEIVIDAFINIFEKSEEVKAFIEKANK